MKARRPHARRQGAEGIVGKASGECIPRERQRTHRAHLKPLTWLLASFLGPRRGRTDRARGVRHTDLAAFAVGPTIDEIGGSIARDRSVDYPRAPFRLDGSAAACVYVAIGGMTLPGMEFCEQLGAFGRIAGVSDALGGNGLWGSAVVLSVAVAVTLAGLRFARALLSTTVAAVRLVIAWIA